ncbi:autotransporter assembly complex family protein [Actibacterium sp. 188UL27-1]|uniref:autotransporter assembly complex protein TamA n=1 Tax=Actibacterium sp. 188UL27-1 TaxID=2786961 RepID=UPI0019582EE9|nr:BamA/TamA family outer membrane protein [Actibacterium sp. 188UL27-1]MBM7068725.1 BamA/TamA family outer membrane protein [Actibacterium sp. 188UL27-1]
MIALLLGFCLASPLKALDDFSFAVAGQDDDLKQLLRRASLLSTAVREKRTAPQDLIATARAEYAALVGALYAKGYYGPTVNVTVDGQEAANLSPLNASGRVGRIIVRVNPGARFRFGTARVAPLAPGTKLPDAFAAGQVAESPVMGDAAKAGVEGWRNVGHAKATLADQSITANHNRKTIAADLRLAPGPRLRFGDLRISGNRRTKTERIRAIAGLPTGETFDPAELDAAARRLRRTGTFRSVALTEGKVVEAGNTLPIDAAIVENKRRRLGVGLELSSQEGLTISTFWLHRNLFRGAEQLRFDLELAQIGGETQDGGSGLDTSLSFRFERPATFTPDTNLFLTGSLSRIDDPGFLSSSASLGGGVTHIFSERLEGELGLSYRTSEVTDDLGTRSFDLLSVPGELTWDNRDNALDATTGLYFSLGLEPFAAISGTEDGIRLTFDGRGYQAVGPVTLAGRVQVGALWGPEVETAPQDFLFFAGGGGTVRGQPFQALGVDLTDDLMVGGRSFLGLQGEVRGKVTETIGLVGFVDSGYIGSESFIDGSGEWISGAGIGLRYDTGLGPIRVDLGVPVNGTPDDAPAVQLYIGIGQAF